MTGEFSTRPCCRQRMKNPPAMPAGSFGSNADVCNQRAGVGTGAGVGAGAGAVAAGGLAGARFAGAGAVVVVRVVEVSLAYLNAGSALSWSLVILTMAWSG